MKNVTWIAVLLPLIWSVGARSDATSPQSQATFVEPKSGLEFIRLPGGKFHFGCEPQDTQCHYEERTDKLATVGAFAFGKTPSTVAAYAKCVAAGACTAPGTGEFCTWKAAGKESNPINCIDWNQATAFCGWLGGRLPTSEEWEYAAKGGESRIYPWGNEPPDASLACYRDTCGSGTVPANTFGKGASKHGLLNMAGNVWQWTSGSFDANQKDIRGGAYFNDIQNLRSSLRYGRFPIDRLPYVGVRCVL